MPADSGHYRLESPVHQLDASERPRDKPNQRFCPRQTGRGWVIGADYRVTVISLLGWVSNPTRAYGARELVGVDRFLRMRALLNRATGGATWLQVTAD